MIQCTSFGTQCPEISNGGDIDYPAGNLVQTETAIPTPSGSVPYVTTMAYDSLNRRVREEVAGVVVKETAWDAAGNRTALVVTPAAPAVLSGTIITTHAIEWTYDPLNRVTAGSCQLLGCNFGRWDVCLNQAAA